MYNYNKYAGEKFTKSWLRLGLLFFILGLPLQLPYFYEFVYIENALNTLQTTYPHNLPSHRIIQYPTLSFDQRKPIACAGDAGIDQLAGENGVGRLR